MLTHMGLCTNCGAGLRVFDHRLGSGLRFNPGIKAPRGYDDDQVAMILPKRLAAVRTARRRHTRGM
jgi:hypothetical protein